MMPAQPPERKIRKAISSLLATHPFFGVLTLRMPLSPGNVKTIAGDGIAFTYNPEWILEAPHDEIKGCMAHIVFACALKHHTRRGGREYGKWQAASRLATAALLEQSDIWVPPGVDQLVRHVKGLDDLPVEVIYDRMEDEDDEEDDAEQPAGGAGDAAVAGAPPPPQKDPFAPESPPEAGQGQGDGQQPDPGPYAGEVQDAPEEQKEQQERQWDRASKQAVAATKAQGHDAGDVEQMFDGQHDHRRDWQDLLRQYMQAVAATDYTWSRPNMRFIDSGLYLPSLHGEGMGPVVVAIDTSGSVDDEHVNRACAEIFAISQDVEPERIWVIQCDTQVQDVLGFDAFDVPEEILIKGRGGTKFQPVFDKVEDMGLTPDVLIYLTDMGVSRMPDDPGYPVLWAVENEGQEAQVPFGDSIVVPKED